MSTDSAIVVLSGGQDSTTCLYWALEHFDPSFVQAVTFDYGQRHRIELDCARDVAKYTGVAHTVLPINTFAALGGTALTQDDIEVAAMPEEGLPNTFVPGRNLVFLTFAAAFAYQRNVSNIVTGVAQTDYSGYPDCRESTLIALERALSLGMDFDFQLHSPLMCLSKKETVEMAINLGAMSAMALTHTCYEGKRPPCGRCPACELRARGFREAGVEDPLTAST